MFGKLGQLASLMGNLPKIKAEMEKLQERLAKLSAEGDAGGGMVRVKVTGQFKLVSCTIAPEAIVSGDRELLEDLIVAATAIRLKLEVLHEDGDFETMARFVPELRQRRISAAPDL